MMPKEFKSYSKKYMFMIIMTCNTDKEYRKNAIHVSHRWTNGTKNHALYLKEYTSVRSLKVLKQANHLW